MWKPWTWILSGNEQAVANARKACVECSRRRVERLEVELFLSRHVAARPVASRSARHPA